MILKGKAAVDQMKAQLRCKAAALAERGITPKLSILRVGARPDDVAYESRVIKNCTEVGIEVQITEVDDKIDMVNFLEALERLNQDSSIHGILVFRPLPQQLDEEEIGRRIAPEKDIDCMNPVNLQRVFTADAQGFAPCTPEAVIELLKFYDYELTGKNVAIVNRSLVLGKPLAMLFLNENATVTICHSRTKDLDQIMKASDIVITGVGRGKFFDERYFSEKTTVIDVGINFMDGKMCGDVAYEKVEGIAAAITPVPGGIGGVTSVILLSHVLKGVELQCGK